MRLDESFLYELRMRNDIESVVSGYVNLKRRGNTMVGLCPFHNEKTPSFTVYTNNGSFYCFGCGAGGDVITFVRQIENLDYMEAVRFLADRSGMTMPTDGYDDSLRQFRMRVLEANRCAARFFHAQLGTAAGAGAAEYLRGRQLTDATVRHFGIGFAPNEWTALYDHLHKNGFEDDVILQANLCSRSSRSNRLFDRFRNRVMFPFIDLRGNVVGFGGRIMPGSDDAAKYINSTDTPVYRKSQFLYGFNFAKNSKRDGIILVEGNVDVVTLHQAGFDNAVAACGTSLTAEHVRLIGRYTDEVILTMDADAAGEKATARTIALLKEGGLKVRVVRVTDGAKDPDEFIKRFGPERFERLISESDNDIEYRLNVARMRYDVESDDGRLSFLRDAAAILAGVDDGIARDLYAGRLSRDYGINKDTLMREIKARADARRRSYEKKAISNAVAPPTARDPVNPEKAAHLRAANAEEMLIALLMTYPSLYEYCSSKISCDDFVTAFNRRVYGALCSFIADGAVPDISLFSADFSPAEMGRIASVVNSTVIGKGSQGELDDCIRVIKEEKSKISSADPSTMDADEWAARMNQIAKKKGS